VGPYTSAAIASIAFNDAAAAVDGNVIRVLSRLRGLTDPKPSKLHDNLAAALLHRERPGCHNQVGGGWGVFGSLVCLVGLHELPYHYVLEQDCKRQHSSSYFRNNGLERV
jgi:endonuclease III